MNKTLATNVAIRRVLTIQRSLLSTRSSLTGGLNLRGRSHSGIVKLVAVPSKRGGIVPRSSVAVKVRKAPFSSVIPFCRPVRPLVHAGISLRFCPGSDLGAAQKQLTDIAERREPSGVAAPKSLRPAAICLLGNLFLADTLVSARNMLFLTPTCKKVGTGWKLPVIKSLRVCGT